MARDAAIGRFIHASNEARKLLLDELLDRSEEREDARLVLRAYIEGKLLSEDDALDKLGFGKPSAGGPTCAPVEETH